jgi:hypothetical protein
LPIDADAQSMRSSKSEARSFRSIAASSRYGGMVSSKIPNSSMKVVHTDFAAELNPTEK